ncbi:TlpA family protein disulfide reductase [Bosea beijingensis]|uniref:TlpA family protein disulfide reductase n=1 Tax=Bosea beijingensis TaxID=3068632 RepID=UPI002741E21F|nr:TlpA disulfide reductase family protein [Bosea sp. REN20]
MTATGNDQPAPRRNTTPSPTRREALALTLLPPFVATPAVARQSPRFAGPSSQFVQIDPPEEAGSLVLTDLAGKTRPLSAYRGKAVLLNFWASWCPPCRRELPILRRLQTTAAREPFVVVPVSLDKSVATVRTYLDRLGLADLATFIDAEGVVASGPKSAKPTPFPLYGMPMTYLLDREARSVGYLVGEADWTSPEGLELLRFYGRAAS